MIITRTPFRISYAGGGTDFKDFYNEEFGAVISTSINKYLYITVNEKFDNKIHLRYSQSEEVDKLDDIQHSIIREALRLVGIKKGIEIVSISDVPAKGSGLGSSSAFTVGLLNALYTLKGCGPSPKFLAEMACALEIDILKAPIGKQDQYACAYGGLNRFVFTKNSVDVVNLNQISKYSKIKQLQDESMLFYLGNTRSANNILKTHKENIQNNINLLTDLRSSVFTLQAWLSGEDSLHSFGNTINTSWSIKKKMSNCTSNEIESIIKEAKDNGASGVKLVGAGGGGFMLVSCPTNYQNDVRFALKNLHELNFSFTNKGSEVIFNDRL